MMEPHLSNRLQIWPWLLGAAVAAILAATVYGLVGYFTGTDDGDAANQHADLRETIMDETIVPEVTTTTTTEAPRSLPIELLFQIIVDHSPPPPPGLGPENLSPDVYATLDDLCFNQLATSTPETVRIAYETMVSLNLIRNGMDPTGWDPGGMVDALIELGCPDPIV